MIFKNYRELINFVLSNYPYQKIITHSKDTHCPWSFGSNKKSFGRYPTKYDIKKELLMHLSQLCYIDIINKVYTPTLDDCKISELYRHYSKYVLSCDYFRVGFRKDRTELYISYIYEFYGDYRFRKYVLPSHHYRWGNKKTLVVFRFRGKQII